MPISKQKEDVTENIDILKLVDNNRYSVAHIQAEKGWTTNNSEILGLKNKEESVLDIIVKYYGYNSSFIEKLLKEDRVTILMNQSEVL